MIYAGIGWFSLRTGLEHALRTMPGAWMRGRRGGQAGRVDYAAVSNPQKIRGQRQAPLRAAALGRKCFQELFSEPVCPALHQWAPPAG